MGVRGEAFLFIKIVILDDKHDNINLAADIKICRQVVCKTHKMKTTEISWHKRVLYSSTAGAGARAGLVWLARYILYYCGW